MAEPTGPPPAPRPLPAPNRPRRRGDADASHLGIPDLGDLGDLTDQSELRRALAQSRRAPAPTPTERATAPACLDRAVTGRPAPEAFASGTRRGRPVLVLVLPGGGDTTTAVLLDQETCQAVSVISLS